MLSDELGDVVATPSRTPRALDAQDFEFAVDVAESEEVAGHRLLSPRRLLRRCSPIPKPNPVQHKRTDYCKRAHANAVVALREQSTN